MRLTRLTAAVLPLAIATFVGVAALQFRGLPGRVPVHFDDAGQADRWAERKQFLGLMLMTAGLLAAGLVFVRHYASTEQVNADHPYARRPELRERVVVTLDVVGGAALLLLAWTAHLCAHAAGQPIPAIPPLALKLPLVTLLLVVAAAAAWTFPLWRRRSPAA